MAIDVGVAPAGTGAPQGDRSEGVNGYVLNTITPETDTTCHYFWAFARNYSLGEQRLTHELREGVAGIFREDEADPGSAAARHRRQPGPPVLQPQHRRRRHVGAAADRPHDRRRTQRRVGAARDPAAVGRMTMLQALRRTTEGDRSQTEKAQLRLRELIVNGGLAPGERLAELALVEQLGVSRTPVRAALQKLQEEGLLEPIPGGGCAVRAFSEADIRDAIEVRGTLEGLAARLAAERGVSAALLAETQECLAAIDDILTPARAGATRALPPMPKRTAASMGCSGRWPAARSCSASSSAPLHSRSLHRTAS